MDIREQIITAIVNGRFGADELLNKIIEQDTYGNDTSKLRIRFTVLNHLIGVLEKYYSYNYLPDGTPITPPVATCLNEVYRDRCIINVNKLIGNKDYTKGQWILSQGYLNDSGLWDNTAVWLD